MTNSDLGQKANAMMGDVMTVPTAQVKRRIRMVDVVVGASRHIDSK